MKARSARSTVNHSPKADEKATVNKTPDKTCLVKKATTLPFKTTSLTACLALALYGLPVTGNIAHAGPENGVVVSGSGSISKTAAQTLIQQNSQNMAINWDSYNVASGERVQYIQPNSQSVSLNRILSSDGSRIAGNIDANGKVHKSGTSTNFD